jgi:hypothetical protein
MIQTSMISDKQTRYKVVRTNQSTMDIKQATKSLLMHVKRIHDLCSLLDHIIS